MSDLISRSELLKAMDTWDKFGYDEHNRLIRIDRTNEEYVPYVRYEDMVNCVMDMTTAYDIDKVVEELESFAKLAEDRWTNGTSKHACQEHRCWVKAIEIVKQGGVSDDVCEWKLEDEESNLYLTECQQRQLIFDGTPKENGYRFCPYCGKKIKVVE